ncbi:dehydrogenase [Bacillus sp. V3-13]|uniref:Gfo/Idh/MocA family protein n=1 Tax=Bacillus sp. V3-13 TaxID=2053728 RepID=UPI000C784ADA|nr:Gfo/Idh/MocA family oxidoreductase [Bacillus sp. V3-13]PLR76700.1 dehydrogenase [Bacillus sp. V3-13]
MKKIRVGIIGTGFSASSHIEALRRIPEVEVAAISSRSLEKAKQCAEKFGIQKAFGNANELIHDPEIEAIHNCTPNYLHYEINREVLLANKHLLSEKPLAMDSKESNELKELAEKSNSVSAVCFNYRHYPLVAEMREMISAQKFGKANLVYGGYIQDWLLFNKDYNWRLEPRFNGLSRAVADIGSHWCDTVQHVLGKKIIEVFADLKTVHAIRQRPIQEAATFSNNTEVHREEVKITTEDYGSVLVHFEDGIHGVFTVSQVSAGRKNRLHFEIAAETATLSWDQEDPNRLWIGRRDEPNKELLRDPGLLSSASAKLAHFPGGHQEGWPDGLKNLLIDFYRAVRSKGENQEYSGSFATLADGDQTMRLIDAILESNQTQKWIRVNKWRQAL